MIVVADSSPPIVLVNIGHVEILAALFGRIIVPPEVAAELASVKRPAAVRAFITDPPPWLEVQSPTSAAPIVGLHPGESAAIALAAIAVPICCSSTSDSDGRRPEIAACL